MSSPSLVTGKTREVGIVADFTRVFVVGMLRVCHEHHWKAGVVKFVFYRQWRF